MEIQKQILLFFATLHNSFLNSLFQLFTILGEELLLTAVAVFIYWNISKKKGFIVCLTLMSSTIVMGISKAIVRFPRPWTMIDDLDVVRQSTATGYSFPSGHTSCAGSAYGAMACSFKKRWLSIACAAIITLVAISRMYLCVHWPMDVAGGLIIGCGSALLLNGLFSKLFDNFEHYTKPMLIIGCALTFIWIGLGIIQNKGLVDVTAFEDLNVGIAMLSGVIFGYILEKSKYDYEIEEGNWKIKIVRYLIGMLGVLLFFEGLKSAFKALEIYNSLTRAVRYFITGFWACGLYPLLGRKLKLFAEKK